MRKGAKILGAVVFILQSFLAAFAQPAAPVLRLESGMHTGVGRRISTDASGRYLLSCSDDKTARMWDISTGKALKIFYVPVGDTREGRLYACALSPDGKIAALGGQTGFEWFSSFSVYIIETQTGDIIGRIESLPAIINDLEFSPDGKRLAVALGKTSGVRVFETDSWQQVATSGDYAAASYNIAFAADGSSAVAAFDGKLRLYDRNFELVKEVRTTTGGKIISIAFHPKDELIAVGYHDSPRIDVRSTITGEVVYQPSVHNTDEVEGALEIVSFSPDGQQLYGAGRFLARGPDSSWKWILRSWDQAGRGTHKDLLLLANAANDIKIIPDGSQIVLGTTPDLGLISKEGVVKWYHPSGAINYGWADRSDFSLNENGQTISFKPGTGTQLKFDVLKRELLESNTTFRSYTDTSLGTRITNWRETTTPVINGKLINFLGVNERSYSADVSRDGLSVLIGGTFNLYLANSKSEKIWKTPLPGIPVSVVINSNNKTATACLSDGTIRWYNINDGKEILAFFLHPDQRRWVLFTPAGYYDASPGAEDLLGWHMNNGSSKTPSFYPVSRYRDHFFRTDIIDAIFETYNESQAINLANQRLGRNDAIAPVGNKTVPVVEIQTPVNGSSVASTSIRIGYRVKTPSNFPLKNIRVLINGRPTSVERGLRPQGSQSGEIDISIPESDCVVTLLAENDNGTSPEANLYLKWKGSGATKTLPSRPTLYVLSVGVSNYNKPEYRLQFPAKDATDFASTLQGQKGKYYGDVVVRELTDASANKVNILDALEWIQKKTTRQDMAMIFFAGHGVNDNNGIYYMLPVDAEIDRLRSTCINFEEIKQIQSTIEGKVIVFIDACHSGNVAGGGGNYINGLINLLTSTVKGAGAITFTSSTGKEVSLEDPSWGNGAFTKAVVEGLEGAAAFEDDNEITYTALSLYISRRVKKLTGGRQNPTLVPTPNTPDFIIATRK
jgi:WD40 repeat protein